MRSDDVGDFGRAYRCFLNGDIGDLLALLCDDVVYHLPGRHLGGGDLVGARALTGRVITAAEYCDAIDVDVLRIVAMEPFLVSFERLRASRSGVRLDQHMCAIWRTHRDGCIAEIWASPADQPACDTFWEAFTP